MYEREKREILENALYENLFAEKMLKSGRIDEYLHYLKLMRPKCKNGMTNDEVDAVKQRVEEAASE
jgi:hypothetical protein